MEGTKIWSRNMFFFKNKNNYEVVSKGLIFDSVCIQLLIKHSVSTHQSHIFSKFLASENAGERHKTNSNCYVMLVCLKIKKMFMNVTA